LRRFDRFVLLLLFMPDIPISAMEAAPVLLFLAIVLFESLFPFRKLLGRWKHFGKNALFALVNSLVTGLAAAGMNIWLFIWIEGNGIGLLNWIEAPFWALVLLASLSFDMWIYWWHRINHRVPFLWRFHQVHHNDTEVDMSTALRFHPGEIILSSIANVIVFTILGISIEMMVVYKIIFNISVLFHHSNVALPERWDRLYRFFLVSPNMHRVHHSRRMRETNSNYASGLAIWDRLFGSYRERDPSEIVFGLEYDRAPEQQKWLYLLKRPFRARGIPDSEGE